MSMKFTDEHEWIMMDGDLAVVGITKFAADALGDVAYAEMPDVGAVFAKGDDMAAVDSVKASSVIFAPVSGEVKAVNTVIMDSADDGEGKPETVNEDPEGKGWFVKIAMSDASELDGLMDKAAYDAFCEGQ